MTALLQGCYLFFRKRRLSAKAEYSLVKLDQTMQRLIPVIALALLALSACKNQKHLSKSMPEAEPMPVVQPVVTPAPATAPPAAVATVPKSTNVLVEEYLHEVATAPTKLAAGRSEAELLSLFDSRSTPVLIVIYQEGDFKDYDEPTTIGAYLEYLRLQNKQPAAVQNIVKNPAGKIIELELYQAD